LREGAFDTALGKRITRGLKDLARRFKIDVPFGFAPRDLKLGQVEYPSEDSVLSMYVDEVSDAPAFLASWRGSTWRIWVFV
jgi:hypothetical protein